MSAIGTAPAAQSPAYIRATLQQAPEVFTSYVATIQSKDRGLISSGSYWRNVARQLSTGDEIRVTDYAMTFCARLLVIYTDKISNVRVAVLSSVDLPSTAEASA